MLWDGLGFHCGIDRVAVKPSQRGGNWCQDTLELHLQNSIARITSDFSSDKERSSVCLQDKLTDLQVNTENVTRGVLSFIRK